MSRQWKREGMNRPGGAGDSALWLGDVEVATIVEGQDGQSFLYPKLYQDQARTFPSTELAMKHAERQLDLWLLQAELRER